LPIGFMGVEDENDGAIGDAEGVISVLELRISGSWLAYWLCRGSSADCNVVDMGAEAASMASEGEGLPGKVE
jgi:hypothetical protein